MRYLFSALYVPPARMALALATVQAYMEGTEGIRKSGQPEMRGYQVIDDRGGSGCWMIQVEWLAPQPDGAKLCRKLFPFAEVAENA